MQGAGNAEQMAICASSMLKQDSRIFPVSRAGDDLIGIRTQSVFDYTVRSIILCHRMTRRMNKRKGIFPLHILLFSSVQSTPKKQTTDLSIHVPAVSSYMT
jgi:hypothetical protein